MMRMHLFVALLATGLTVAAPPETRPEFDPGKVSFSVEVRGESVPYRVFAVNVLPEVDLPVAVAGKPPAGAYEAVAEGGRLGATGPASWTWKAPAETGVHSLTIRATATGESIRLNLFVIVPRARVENEHLNGYRIGAYPAIPLKGLEIYRPPRGFIEVTEENLDTALSPHFVLRQFLCKQDGGYPKYVVVRERLVLKLEHLLEHVNEEGIRADTFTVMSGYRTPYYNHAIGNVKYSRHVWGGAADVYIDEQPRDGVMDDLDGNGKIDVYDAGVLYDLIDRLYGKKSYEPYVGGLGRYKANAVHGPFVHVDVRGTRARWGD